ncbi:prolipoprotein diacylglyceryl transferase [Blattabacterium cuenoti]|uniref:prolipoprotein diacylglyceryl transferase n=1 Tax=Blattabacterium cuenoti TaxID=1653831 RepID=UPI00163D1427|nr:prolipoprotein diacylglyceryl transferase [Blattabacterium cuenoti]
MLLEYINWNPIHKFILWNKITIHIYSLMFIISFILGWYIMQYIYRCDKIHEEKLDSLLIYTFIGTFLGSRLGQVFFYDFLYFSNHWIEIFIPIKATEKNHVLLGYIKGYEFTGYRGLSSHGAAIGLLLSNFFYNKKILKKNFIWLCDRLCIAVSISASFIRIGNFFNSEIVGIPCNKSIPWAVKFVQMDKEYGKVVPRHPTQIYESIIYISIFFLLFFLYCKMNKTINGLLSGLFFIFIWTSRFFLEFLKEPQGNEFLHLFFLNTGQLLSIPFVLFGGYLIFLSIRKK